VSVAPGLTRKQAFVLAAALLAYLCALAYVNGVWACYPYDNDLDEVGWLVQHLSWQRPESLANQGYPPGFLLVLRALRPLVGSLLPAALLWQAFVTTCSLFFVFRIALAVSQRAGTAALAMAGAALATLPVATSEFADGTATALFLAGLWACVARGADARGFFWLGTGAGLAYLFRTHYLVLVALVPVAALASRFPRVTLARATAAFAGGFAATAWPLWLLNSLAYGNPLHAGVSQYNIALAMIPDAFDWEDYAQTYDRWPLSRILRERPAELVLHVISVTRQALTTKISLAALALGSVAAFLGDAEQRRTYRFLGVLALSYVLVVIAPTNLSDRAFVPVVVLACLLIAGGLGELARRVTSRASRPSSGDARPAPPARVLSTLAGRTTWAAAFLAGAGACYPPGIQEALLLKRQSRADNQVVVDVLLRAGMTSSGEVFCTNFNVYNLADPDFVSFHNYGGWIQLDSVYAAERPPPRARTLQEWRDFFSAHAIRFAILERRPDTEELFTRTPPAWSLLAANEYVAVFALGNGG
jgi:hypothetical protein